jgi:hypothetical protein
MKCVCLVTRFGDNISAYRDFLGNVKERGHFEDVGLDGGQYKIWH